MMEWIGSDPTLQGDCGRFWAGCAIQTLNPTSASSHFLMKRPTLSLRLYPDFCPVHQGQGAMVDEPLRVVDLADTPFVVVLGL